MDADPARTAARRGRVSERLGENPVCYFCGYRNPVALMIRFRTLLEEDHTYSRKRDLETTVTICRNCHAEIGEDRTREGIRMRRERDPVERAAYMLLARAVFLEKDARSMRSLAADLFKVVETRRGRRRRKHVRTKAKPK